jgi:hypothetical protein
VLQDNSFVKVELYNLSFDPSAVNTTFTRGALAKVPVSVLASGGAIDFTNSSFTPSTIQSTYVASKADVFSEITNLFDLTDSGTATTSSGTTNASAYAIVTVSAAGILAGDWVRLGSGDNAEYHLVHSVTTNTLNLRTQVLRAASSGAAVVKQTKTAVAGLTGGFSIACQASSETQRVETQRVSMGLRIGNVALSLSGNLNSLTPENFQLLFGIPAAAYANSVLPLGSRIGTIGVKTLLFEGLCAGGKKLSIVGWNGTVVAGSELTFTQASLAQGPFSVKPNGLQLFVHA